MRTISYSTFAKSALCVVAGAIALYGLVFFLSPLTPGPDLFFVSGRQLGHQDGEYYAYDIKGAARQAAGAEVLFLGNSHMQCAVDENQMLAFARSSGLRLYNFAFGHDEGASLPLRLIEQHHLRPKAVIINVDADTFSKPLSGYADAVVKRGVIGAYAYALSNHLTFASRVLTARLAGWAARHRLLSRAPEPESYLLRSLSTGCWRVMSYGEEGWEPGKPQKPRAIVPAGNCTEAGEGEIAAARSFVAKAKALGITVGFVDIPYDASCPERTGRLAAASGAVFLPIDAEGLNTYDGLHLDVESSRRYSARLFQEIEARGLLR